MQIGTKIRKEFYWLKELPFQKKLEEFLKNNNLLEEETAFLFYVKYPNKDKENLFEIECQNTSHDIIKNFPYGLSYLFYFSDKEDQKHFLKQIKNISKRKNIIFVHRRRYTIRRKK